MMFVLAPMYLLRMLKRLYCAEGGRRGITGQEQLFNQPTTYNCNAHKSIKKCPACEPWAPKSQAHRRQVDRNELLQLFFKPNFMRLDVIVQVQGDAGQPHAEFDLGQGPTVRRLQGGTFQATPMPLFMRSKAEFPIGLGKFAQSPTLLTGEPPN